MGVIPAGHDATREFAEVVFHMQHCHCVCSESRAIDTSLFMCVGDVNAKRSHAHIK